MQFRHATEMLADSPLREPLTAAANRLIEAGTKNHIAGPRRDVSPGQARSAVLLASLEGPQPAASSQQPAASIKTLVPLPNAQNFRRVDGAAMYRHFSCERRSWAKRSWPPSRQEKSGKRSLDLRRAICAMSQRIPHFANMARKRFRYCIHAPERGLRSNQAGRIYSSPLPHAARRVRRRCSVAHDICPEALVRNQTTHAGYTVRERHLSDLARQIPVGPSSGSRIRSARALKWRLGARRRL